ncbi:MAG: tetratricopeptide repeat protein [Nitrospirae bacterium]|nr:tetratricopeptide repeat protein [Nitrospirota bacterium]
MKRNFRHVPRGLFLLALITALLAVSSCAKEEPASTKTAETRAVNPYSNESVFDEVKKKLEKNPDDVDALYHLADLYNRDAQYEQAIEAYKKVVKLKPTMGYAYFKMGTAYDRLNRPAEAVEAFKKALKYMPNYAVAYNNLGVAYGNLEKYGEEITALKKAIKLRPNYSSARYNLGYTYLRKGDRKAALREYEALKKLDEGAAEALKKEIDKAS